MNAIALHAVCLNIFLFQVHYRNHSHLKLIKKYCCRAEKLLFLNSPWFDCFPHGSKVAPALPTCVLCGGHSRLLPELHKARPVSAISPLLGCMAVSSPTCPVSPCSFWLLPGAPEPKALTSLPRACWQQADTVTRVASVSTAGARVLIAGLRHGGTLVYSSGSFSGHVGNRLPHGCGRRPVC